MYYNEKRYFGNLVPGAWCQHERPSLWTIPIFSYPLALPAYLVCLYFPLKFVYSILCARAAFVLKVSTAVCPLALCRVFVVCAGRAYQERH